MIVNISGSQRWLSQKAAYLGVELVYLSNISDRDQSRKQLLSTIDQLQRNHQELVQGNPAKISTHQLSNEMKMMYFNPPINMQTRIDRYTSEALALANTPAHLLTPDNPHSTYLIDNRENLLESLDQIVTLYQQESEAKVRRLQMLDAISGVIVLITLTLLGLYIFRPLTNTLVEERTQLERANQELNFLSSVDGLTGIPNRRCFDQFLSQLWSQSTRIGEPIALIMCDIDFFKAYNDTYGHLQGDECLKKVATTLKDSLKRQVDFVARYGGEEFVVVLSNTQLEGAKNVAETLRANVENMAIPHRLSSISPSVTISLGLAIGYANSTVLPEALIEAADNALYQAKQNGRNRHEIANSTIKPDTLQ